MKEVGASFEVFFIASSIFTYNYLQPKCFVLHSLIISMWLIITFISSIFD